MKISRKHLFKRKFLDLFTFIYVTKKNDDNVSITCLEKRLLKEIIVRIVNNFEIYKNTLNQLRELVNALNDVVNKNILFITLRDYEKRVYLINIFLNIT